MIALVLCAGILLSFLHDRKFMLYAGVFMLLYYLNSPWLLLSALVILTIFAALDFILRSPESEVQGFLAAGHAATVTGVPNAKHAMANAVANAASEDFHAASCRTPMR